MAVADESHALLMSLTCFHGRPPEYTGRIFRVTSARSEVDLISIADE